jgi:transcription elongation factor GreA
MHLPETAPVTVGSRVLLSDADGAEEYVLAPEDEVEPGHGRISANSPIGQAVLGHHLGDKIEVRTPGGLRRITIAAVTQ